MKKVMLFTLGGLIGLVGSVILFYLFLIGLNDNPNPFLLIGSLAGMAAGVYAFIRTTKLSEPKKEPLVLASAFSDTMDGTDSAIQKNNEMVNQYNKTAKAREQLRMLELANSAQKE